MWGGEGVGMAASAVDNQLDLGAIPRQKPGTKGNTNKSTLLETFQDTALNTLEGPRGSCGSTPV